MKYRLDNIEKREPYTIPEGYLDELPRNIMSRLPEKNKPKPWIVWLRWSLAPAFMVLLAFFLWPSDAADYDKILAQVPDEAIIAYLQDEGISEYLVMDYLDSWDSDEGREVLLDEIDLDELNNEYEYLIQ